MLGIHDLALFIVSGLLLNMMPGPDSLLIMLRSGSQGWRAGSVAALGIGTGTMVHVLAAALGRNPELLVLDEPAAGVDVRGERLFWEMLDAARRERGFTQIMVSHNHGNSLLAV